MRQLIKVLFQLDYWEYKFIIYVRKSSILNVEYTIAKLYFQLKFVQ